MTIFDQTRLELAAEPELGNRVNLALNSITQRLQEAVEGQDMTKADELLADLRGNHPAWAEVILLGGKVIKAEPLGQNLQAPAEAFQPLVQPEGLQVDQAPALMGQAPVPVQVETTAPVSLEEPAPRGRFSRS